MSDEPRAVTEPTDPQESAASPGPESAASTEPAATALPEPAVTREPTGDDRTADRPGREPGELVLAMSPRQILGGFALIAGLIIMLRRRGRGRGKD